MAKLLEPPPPGTTRIVEPFLGSGGYTVYHGRPGLGLDQDARVIDLWRWLQGTTPEELQTLQDWWEARRTITPPPNLDEIRERFGPGPELYFKIMVCGAYVGQWSSSKCYPQHSLRIKDTIEALDSARRIEVHQRDWSSVGPNLVAGDMVLLDPPYIGTKGNYLKEGIFDPSKLVETLLNWDAPVLFTYGNGAPELFPELTWEIVQRRKVPRLRGGGTVDRVEWVSYVRWPERSGTLGIFGD